MYIAPNFTDEDWNNLDLDNNEDDWQKAIDVFYERLNSRYVEPVDKLIILEKNVSPKNKRYGFTCLAIDMLLIETVQAFKEGLKDSAGQSKALFERFLAESERFNRYFTCEDERIALYKEFRCGILHQAEVQGSALVWSVGDLYDRISIPNTLNRCFFHQELKNDLNDYIGSLRVAQSTEIRKAFRAKMDFIVTRATSE
jgi:hypothetical protein